MSKKRWEDDGTLKPTLEKYPERNEQKTMGRRDA